jgi:hypothetical protein
MSDWVSVQRLHFNVSVSVVCLFKVFVNETMSNGWRLTNSFADFF